MIGGEDAAGSIKGGILGFGYEAPAVGVGGGPLLFLYPGSLFH
jgi:hypothetical protein